MVKKWKKSVDEGKTFAALLTDLSKTFDCLPYNFIIASLNVFGFSFSAVRLIQSYLSNRKQRAKINSTYTSWEKTLFSVSQDLGAILFNSLNMICFQL